MNSAPQGGGLFASLKGLAATTLAILQTRLELIVTELEAEKLRLSALVTYAAAAFFMLGFGVILLALFLTVLLWDSYRLLALGSFTVLFLGAGVIALLAALRHARAGSRLFQASLAELAQDQEALRPNEPAGRSFEGRPNPSGKE